MDAKYRRIEFVETFMIWSAIIIGGVSFWGLVLWIWHDILKGMGY